MSAISKYMRRLQGLQVGPETFSREYVESVVAAQNRTDISFAEMGFKVLTKDLTDGLAAIVDRADNGDLGTSKVQDMRRIAADLLKKMEGV